MIPTDFAKHLTFFLSDYLPMQKNISNNTILSYRDTFKLLIYYYQEIKNISAEHLTLKTLTSDCLIDFLEWLERERKCSISTRNQRLGAIHSFFRYLQAEEPASIFHFQKILSIPVKKAQKAIVEYLTADAIQLLLEQPNKHTQRGRRDLTLLSVLYDSGARVQELIDMRPCDLTLQLQSAITITGKGRKIRRVCIMKHTAFLLQSYLQENKLDQPSRSENPLFSNSQQKKLTKEGVAYILSKYIASAKKISPIIPLKVNVHMLRHSKAMHLLQGGVNLIYIRDFLGHTDIKTTEIYARADTEMKRKAIENVYPDLIDSNLPDWNKNQALLSWLSNLK